MRLFLQLKFLFILLLLFGCESETKVETTEAQIGIITPNSSSTKIVVSKQTSITPQKYQYYFAGVKSGLNYRASPKGEILGKFYLNTQLKVLYRTKIFDQITVSRKTVEGEWLAVEKEKDTVYVFNAFLSASIVMSDINIYAVSSFYQQKDVETRQAFLNVSETYFKNKDENILIPAKEGLKDTIKLNTSQRKAFLETIKVSELDSAFIYDTDKDTIYVYKIQNLPVIACTSIYYEGNDLEKVEGDFGFGFDLGKFSIDNHLDFTYIGQTNPFQTGKIKPIIWEKIDSKNFPTKQGIDTAPKRILNQLKNTIAEDSYLFSYNHLNYYIQNLKKYGHTTKRHLVVLNSITNEVVFNVVFEEFNSEYLTPLSLNINSPDYTEQWTGEIFKDKPAIIYGFTELSFDCSSIFFLGKGEPSIRVRCDNRH